jgi:hypothetical protein
MDTEFGRIRLFRVTDNIGLKYAQHWGRDIDIAGKARPSTKDPVRK